MQGIPEVNDPEELSRLGWGEWVFDGMVFDWMALNKARDAAGTRVADEAHLDKLTFENLKLRKKVHELETHILSLKEGSAPTVSAEKVDAEVLKYKKLQEEAVKKENSLREEKVTLAAQLKELSFKYTELSNEEKDFDKKISVKI